MGVSPEGGFLEKVGERGYGPGLHPLGKAFMPYIAVTGQAIGLKLMLIEGPEGLAVSYDVILHSVV